MRVLLDTHSLIWWLDGGPRLSARAKGAIRTHRNEVLVSAATVWEIALKVRSGKLSIALNPGRDLVGVIADQGFLPLAVTLVHAQQSGNLGGTHRDPFDLLLMAQALLNKLAVVSADRVFDAYGINRIW